MIYPLTVFFQMFDQFVETRVAFLKVILSMLHNVSSVVLYSRVSWFAISLVNGMIWVFYDPL